MIAPHLLIKPKAKKYSDGGRLWQGIPSIEKTAAGNYFAVFYSGGKTEENGNFVVLITSTDSGNTWRSPEMVIEHDNSNVRVFDPCLWIDPKGRLWLTWSQSETWFDGRNGVWASVCDKPDDEQMIWSNPRRIANGIMMNKPTVTSDGTWFLPCAIWKCNEPTQKHNELSSEYYSNVYASSDDGKTFKLRGYADISDRSFDEHMIVELNDKKLWMLVRTKYGIGESFSTDNGYNWSPGKPSDIKGPDSRFFIRRLSSGYLLLVNHFEFYGRNNLMAMISDDDGKTWKGGLMLDERDNVSYPDGLEEENGLITIIYDRERYKDREILIAKFRIEDVLAGKCISSESRLKQVINKATG